MAALLLIFSLDLLSDFVLLVKEGISCLDYVHLQDSTRCLLLRMGYVHLLRVILQLRDHIIQNQLQRVQVTPHRELLFVLVATDQRIVPLEQCVQSIRALVEYLLVDRGDELVVDRVLWVDFGSFGHEDCVVGWGDDHWFFGVAEERLLLRLVVNNTKVLSLC